MRERGWSGGGKGKANMFLIAIVRVSARARMCNTVPGTFQIVFEQGPVTTPILQGRKQTPRDEVPAQSY